MKKTLAIFLTMVIVISSVICVPILVGSATGDAPSFSFADGDWKITQNAGGTATPNATAKTVSFTGAQYQSAYTKISKLTPNTIYEISIDVDVAINSQLWVLPGDENLTFNDTVPINASCISTINGTKFKVQLDAQETSYHLIFRNIAGTTAYTFSNLKLDAVQTLTDAETAGNAIADSDWKITTNAGGTVNKNTTAHTVTFTGAQSQTMYTKLTGLTANTTYKLSFDVSPTMNAQVWLLSGEKTVSFTIDGTVPSGAASIGSINGTTAEIEFTAEETTYYIFFRNALTTSGTTEFSFSKFKFEESNDVSAGDSIANGDWKITQNAGGTVSHNKSEHTVSFTGAQYQTMYTKLTGLTANTTYKLTFDISPTMNAQVWSLVGSAQVEFTIDGTVPNGAASVGSVNGTSAIVEFTAEDDSQYIFFRNALSTGATSNFTFSNFNIVAKEIGEPTGADVANGTWWSTRGATYTTSGNIVMWTSDPSYHSIYTELKGLKPNTKYELSFEHNIVDANQLEVVWLYKGTKNSMTLNSAKDRPAEYTSCNVEKKAGKIIATFTTEAKESVYCIGMKVANANGLILSNFAFGKWIPKEVTADDMVNGQWTLGDGGRSTTDLVGTDGWGKFYGENGSVTITDPNSCRTSFIKVTGFIPEKSYELIFNASGIASASVVLEDGSAYIDGNYQSLHIVSGKNNNVVSATVEGNRYIVRFTAKNDYIYLTVKNSSGTVTLSDFIFDPLRISAGTEWGGKVSIAPSDIVAKGTDVTFTATPNIGNSFVGWSDGTNIVSTEKIYTVKAENNISLVAVFDGKNTSSDDLFAQRGYDGTFENSTIPGWYATHYNKADADYVSFCNYTVSNRHAYQGEKSLRIQAYHRCSILPIANLNKNTNYRLSFYMYYEDHGTVSIENINFGHISSSAVIDSRNIHISTAEKVYANTITSGMKPNSGWQRMDYYFNSGDETAVNYLLYYGSDDYSTGCVYIDNMTLSEYVGNDTVLNSSFSSVMNNGGITQPEGWITYAESATDGSNGVLKLQKNQNAYQILNTEIDGLYTVSFKAKGKVRGAAVDIAKNSTNVVDLLSSVSYTDTNGDAWKNYSFNFYTNNHKAVKLMFEGIENGAMVDDIKVVKAEMSAGGMVEKVDFETERFEVSDYSGSAFSLYTATSSKDNNVLSGKTSLKFTPIGKDESDKFVESYMSFQGVKGVSYTVTFNYKSLSGGSLYLAPDISEKFCTEQPFYYSLDEKGWQKVEFHFTTLDAYSLKAVMASVAESVKGIVYFDDISIRARLPLIQGYNLEKTYCDALYNVIDFTSFENFNTSGNMGTLPKGFNVIKSDDAPSGNNIMTVNAGSKYIFAFKAEPTKIYQLGVSLKGDAKTKGSVYVSVDANGKYYYCDTNEIARSKIAAPKNGEWVRDSFSFTTLNAGTIYVVIECSSGTMKIDDLMLFKEAYATLDDNNDYTEYEPYDYKNPPVKIKNGGINADGTIWDGNTDNWMGSLGDFVNIELAVILLIVSVTIVLAAVLLKSRKEERHE